MIWWLVCCGILPSERVLIISSCSTTADSTVFQMFKHQDEFLQIVEIAQPGDCKFVKKKRACVLLMQLQVGIPMRRGGWPTRDCAPTRTGKQVQLQTHVVRLHARKFDATADGDIKKTCSVSGDPWRASTKASLHNCDRCESCPMCGS